MIFRKEPGKNTTCRRTGLPEAHGKIGAAFGSLVPEVVLNSKQPYPQQSDVYRCRPRGSGWVGVDITRRNATGCTHPA